MQWNGGPIGTTLPHLEARNDTVARTPQKKCPEGHDASEYCGNLRITDFLVY
jgi:hypothetical protein